MSAEAQPAKRGFWASLRRWFSWRRKRFYLITLPVSFVMAIVLTLVLLWHIPGLERHEWKIGDQVIVAVSGEEQGSHPTWYNYRRFEIGPFTCEVSTTIVSRYGISTGRMENWGGWCEWRNERWGIFLRCGAGEVIL